MKIGKRLLSAVLAAALAGGLLINGASIPTASAAESIISYQDFEALADGMVPHGSSANPNYVPGLSNVQARANVAGNSIAVKEFEENGAMKKAVNMTAINSTTGGYNYLETKVVDTQTPNPQLFQGKVVFENRIRLDQTTGEFFIMGRNSATSSWLTFVKFKDGQVNFLNKLTLDDFTYESNRWYRTTITVDVDGRTADLQIDGVTLASGVSIDVTSIDFTGPTDSDAWTFRYQNNNRHATNTLSVDIDYFKYYYPSETLELSDSLPRDRQNFVPLDTSRIELDFSNPLNPDTVQQISVTDHAGDPVSTTVQSVTGAVYLDSTGATVFRYVLQLTDGGLTDQSEYHVNFNGVQDLYGNTLNHTMKFTTRARIIGEISDDATLKSLKIDDTAVLGFDPGTYSYSETYPFGTTTIPVLSAEANSVYAAVYTNQATELPGIATVRVIAETGTEHTYSVNFLVEAPRTNNLLKMLKVDEDHLLRFLPKTNAYTYTVPYGTTVPPTVEAEVADEFATMTIQQAETLPGTAMIEVTAQDSSVNMYTIHFTMEAPSNDASLRGLTIDGTPVADFAKDKREYEAKLPYRSTIVPQVLAVPSHRGAAVSVLQPTGTGDGESIVTVTAQDGITTQEYRIRFAEGKKSDLYVVSGYELLNGEGASVSSLEPSVSVTGSVQVSNESNTTSDVTLAVVLYGPDHAVKQIVTETESVPFGTSVKVSTAEALQLPAAVDGYFMKIFVWDSLESMQSLGPVYTLAGGEAQ